MKAILQGKKDNDKLGKTGIQIVTGDIQVPDPETESSVVPRSYADGKLSKSGGHLTGLVTTDKGIYNFGGSFNNSATSYMLIARIKLLHNYADGCLVFKVMQRGTECYSQILLRFPGGSTNPNGPNVFKKTGQIGAFLHHSDTATFDLYVQSIVTLDSIVINHIDTVWSSMNNRFEFTYPNTVTETLPENAIEATYYTDSSSYHYAKAAGFLHDETSYKRNLKFLPAIFDFQYVNNSATGYKKLATAQMAVNSASGAGNLIIEGCIRHWSATASFKIIVNNRMANNAVSFYGEGSQGSSTETVGNIVVAKNADNKYEVYFEKASTDSKYQMVFLRVTWDGPKQWNIENLTDTTLTSGDIPGTKVWDLKTAWGDTSRTQITKEEVERNLTIANSSATGSYPLTFNGGGNKRYRLSTGQRTINGVAHSDLKFFESVDGGATWRTVAYLNPDIMTDINRITDDTILTYGAAKMLFAEKASAIPAAAPSLEISSSEEENEISTMSLDEQEESSETYSYNEEPNYEEDYYSYRYR